MIKEVDNFDILAEKFFETPLDKDEYYLVHLLLRAKDGHNVNGSNIHRTVKYYIVKSARELLALKPEIVSIVNGLHCRAYIYPQTRSFKSTANEALLGMTHAYIDKLYSKMQTSFLAAATSQLVITNRKYIVDIDDEQDLNSDFVKKVINKIFEVRGAGSLANSSNQGAQTDKIFLITKSKSGLHIITHPFDTQEFIKDFPDHKLINFVHTNSPTILYYSWEEN